MQSRMAFARCALIAHARLQSVIPTESGKVLGSENGVDYDRTTFGEVGPKCMMRTHEVAMHYAVRASTV